MAEDVMERWKALVALARDSRLGDPTPHSACIVDFAAEIERLRAQRNALVRACEAAQEMVNALIEEMSPSMIEPITTLIPATVDRLELVSGLVEHALALARGEGEDGSHDT